ncbi:MAG: hypothetical protein IKQ54_10125 [Oscillospiraceae bacterium]|nr:hypothetical protein [Oscillospiraceae bacterium]MBR4194668.1 hypothetical protein [Oscillospiraceae bacterium]
MKYSNALKGIKIIHWAELVTLLLTVCSLGMLVLEQLLADPEKALGPFSWVVLILSLAALALELAGIFRAAKDERLFIRASNGMVMTLILSFAVLFLEEGELPRTVLELLTIVPTIYCSVTVIHAIMRLAEKLDNAVLLARKPFLIRAVVLLSLGAMGLEFISALFLHGERYETLHAIFHTMILTMELVEVSIFLGCTSQAERMLHHGAHAEEA